MNIEEQILPYQKLVKTYNARLVAVSKTKPISAIEAAYKTGQRIFGENKVQELVDKQEALPNDIDWHMIGHLQTNKVKYIAPFITLIHAVDSIKLIKEINKQALKNNRTINCLLQLHLSSEETKFGFSSSELQELLDNNQFDEFSNVKITGVMGMATNTKDKKIIKSEFKDLYTFFEKNKTINTTHVAFQELSMGMSNDYQVALEEGSTLIRIGSAIFGERNYNVKD